MSTAFIPNQASSTSIVVSGSSGSASVPANTPQVRFVWVGSLNCQVRWGKGAQTAVTTDMQLVPGSPENFTKSDADTIAVIGTGTLYIICGTGD